MFRQKHFKISYTYVKPEKYVLNPEWWTLKSDFYLQGNRENTFYFFFRVNTISHVCHSFLIMGFHVKCCFFCLFLGQFYTDFQIRMWHKYQGINNLSLNRHFINNAWLWQEWVCITCKVTFWNSDKHIQQKLVKIIPTFATPTHWCGKEAKWKFNAQKQKRHC